MRDAVLLKTNMEMVPLLLGQNKVIFDDQPAYDKAKDLVADL